MAQTREEFIKQNLSIPDYFDRVIFDDMADYYVGGNTDFELRPVVRCPLHTEDTGSFSFRRDTDSFYCFGCGKGGDVINLHKYHMLLNHNAHVSHESAVKYLIALINDQDIKDAKNRVTKDKGIITINKSTDLMRFNIELNRYIRYAKEIMTTEQIGRLMIVLYHYRDMVHKQSVSSLEAIGELKIHWKEILSDESSS